MFGSSSSTSFFSEALSLNTFGFSTTRTSHTSGAVKGIHSTRNTAIFTVNDSAASTDLASTNGSLVTNNDTDQEEPSSTSSTTTSNRSTPSFENFDYEYHWYPVIWEEDLELDEPTKVTIFDVDYVVAKTQKGEVIAMKDYCTHKGAALSEGRITKSGYFQCAYHGWSFNGKTGDCVEIPQIVKHGGDLATIPSRACTTAVPAQIHQGLVWLFPGGGLEKALTAPPPPSYPKMFDGLKKYTYVRDFPIDFPILLSNICDPDHGLFAHQDSAFDMYTASLDCPFESFSSEEIDDGKGWVLETKVDSKDKIQELDRSRRDTLDPKQKKTKKKKSADASTPWATSRFHAPTHVRLNRVDKETGAVKFASLFYVCPVGVGRSRFLSAGISPLKVPRWVVAIIVSNFLDQDTYLLATQQKNLLMKEADDLRQMMKEQGIDASDTEKVKKLRLRTRRNAYCLPSPTERSGSKMEQFWDATLARCPNRVKHLIRLDESGALLETPSREIVLNRKTQILDNCKDLRDVVRNCGKAKRASTFLAISLSIAKFVSLKLGQPSLMRPLLKMSSMSYTFAILFMVSKLADKLEKEYFFKYTDDYRRRDMKKIPEKIWIDR